MYVLLELCRAERYLGILVALRYRNQVIPVSSKFQKTDIIAFGIIAVSRNSFQAIRLVITILLKTKTWYLQNQINKKIKTP